jgi:hypothetical protein
MKFGLLIAKQHPAGVSMVDRFFRIQWPGMEQAKVLRTITPLAERVMPAFRG